MRAAVLILLAAMLVGCSAQEECTSRPQPTTGLLLRLDLATGAVRSLAEIPHAAREAPRQIRTTTLTSHGQVLHGPGPSPWRLAGAAGEELGSVGGVVVVLGDDHQLRGIRFRDGRPEWNARLDHHLVLTSALFVGGRVVAVGQERDDPNNSTHAPRVTAYAFEPTRGRLLWKAMLSVEQHDRAEVHDADKGRVLLSLDPNRPTPAQVVSLDARTGAVAWTTHVPLPRVAALDLAGDEVVVANAELTFGCD